MATNEEMEMQLWDYIDGTCSEADKSRIAALIEQNAVWQQRYHELYEFHISLAALETEQPSLRFSKNVMEAIATTHVARATRKYINTNIIKGIAAFFVLTIISLIGYAIATGSKDSSTSYLPRLDTPKVNIGSYFNHTTISIFIAINVALGLLLVDAILRRKRSQHTTQ